MANISFFVKGSATISQQHVAKAWVTIEERAGGSLFFKVKQVGGMMGNLHGLYFDISDEAIMNTLRITAISMGICADEDSIIATKNGTDLIEAFPKKTIGSVGHKEIFREYSFTLQSTKRGLVLSDFSSMQLDYSNRTDDADVTVNDDDSHRWLYLVLL